MANSTLQQHSPVINITEEQRQKMLDEWRKARVEVQDMEPDHVPDSVSPSTEAQK